MTTTATTQSTDKPGRSIPALAEAPKHNDSAQAALATGGYEFPGIPKFDDSYRKRQWQLEQRLVLSEPLLVRASRRALVAISACAILLTRQPFGSTRKIRSVSQVFVLGEVKALTLR